jgi:hypothetical protein
LTRKRIEIAVLVLLAVVLGFYVRDRLGMRMGGTTSSLESELETEEDWMLHTILRDIAVTASYARGTPIDGIDLTIDRLPTGALTLPVAIVNVRLGDVSVQNREVPLERSFWNPGNYAGLAGELLGEGVGNASASDGGAALRALLDPQPSVLCAENDRISARLASNVRDPSAHEEAALLLGAFGLREAAYGFNDKRFVLLRMTAHLAVARALRGGALPGTAGTAAEAALLALAGRQADLMDTLERLPRDSDDAQSWRSALYMYSTDDWRTPAPAQGLLVQLMRFRAYAAALGTSNAIDRMPEAAESKLPDWGRILTWHSSRDVSVRGFIESQLARELAEVQEVGRLHGKELRSPREGTAALNELPGDLVEPEGPRVLPWGLWAAFLQRHIVAAIVVRIELVRETLGLPKDAEEFSKEAEKAFSGLRLYPIVQIHRTRYVGARVEDTLGMDDSIALTRKHPELLNPIQWQLLEDTALHMMRKRGMPSSASWFSASVLGTSLLDPTSARFEIVQRSIDAEQLRDMVAEMAPKNPHVIYGAVKRSDTHESTFEALSSRLSERAEFDRTALRSLLDAARAGSERLSVLEKMCALDGNECDRLGWELVDAGRDEEAADAFQQLVDRAPSRINVCNDADWLVSYYFRTGRVQEAVEVAEIVAEVYCSNGLQTKAHLLERMGRFVEAEVVYRANEKRYDSDDPVSFPLLGFYYRMARVAGYDAYEAQASELLSKVFPDDLQALPSGMDTAAPAGGVLIDGNSETLKAAGLRGGDVIVGLDGWRVRSLDQYDAIRHLRPLVGGARDAKLRVWSQGKYIDASIESRDRRLYVAVRTFGAKPPSTEER